MWSNLVFATKRWLHLQASWLSIGVLHWFPKVQSTLNCSDGNDNWFSSRPRLPWKSAEVISQPKFKSLTPATQTHSTKTSSSATSVLALEPLTQLQMNPQNTKIQCISLANSGFDQFASSETLICLCCVSLCQSPTFTCTKIVW